MFTKAQLGLELPTTLLSAAEVLTLAAFAEARGVGTIWLAEGGKDIISLLGALSQVTKRTHIATGPVDTWSRTPYLLAMTARSLDELTGGRFILGLSPGYTKSVETQHGLVLTDLDDAPKRVTEILRVVKALLAGETVTVDGQFVHIEAARLPNDGPSSVPIYLNARQGEMLELAGLLGDGAILSIATPRWVTEYAIPHVADGAARAGRALSEVEIVYHPILCLSDDDEAALAAARRAVSGYFINAEVIQLLRAYGYADEMAEVEAAKARGERPVVPEELIRAITIVGKRDAITSRLEAYEAAGINRLIIRPYPVSGESAHQAVVRAIDHFMA